MKNKWMLLAIALATVPAMADADTIPPEVKAVVKKISKNQDLEKCTCFETETEFQVSCRVGDGEYPELSIRINRKTREAKPLIVYKNEAMQMPEVKPIYEAARAAFEKAGLGETQPEIISVVLKPNGAIDYYYVAQIGGMFLEFDAKKKPRTKVRDRASAAGR